MKKAAAIILGTALGLACAENPTEVEYPVPSPSFEVSSVDFVGSLETGIHNSAAVASGFPCSTLSTITYESHATISDSGNQLLWCMGTHDFVLDETLIITNQNCALHFDGQHTTDSKVVLNPTGAAILICRGNS